MRAKFVVTAVEPNGPSNVTLKMRPVSDKPYDKDGVSEDSSFSRWTPWGDLVMGITNPNLVDTFTVGEKYYLDFVMAE